MLALLMFLAYMPVLCLYMPALLILLVNTVHVCIVDGVHVFYFCTKFSTQGHLVHAVMNIDENLSVTENPFHLDSLEDWVHG